MKTTTSQEMTYRGCTIIANCKTYSQFTIDKDGLPYMHHYDFEGTDIISYTTDEYPDVDFDTIAELKKFLDGQEDLL